MKNKIIYPILALTVIAVIGITLYYTNTHKTAEETTALSPKDATYIIDGQPVTLINGEASVPAAPGSASKITTRYFGNEVTYDFDGDGRQDSAFLITQSNGGSGTFYYIVAALNTSHGYVGSHALLLGDRIAPQTTEMSQNKATPKVIVVNYAVRKPDESFAVAPSVGKSMWVLLDPQTLQFGEVAQNFEGEADQSKMSLGMQTWNWITTMYNNDTKITPKVERKFTIAFKDNNTFSASTDCNSIGGEYAVTGNKITLSKMMSTEMFCKESQEEDFKKMLNEVQSFLFTSKGELILELKNDSGTMIFR